MENILVVCVDVETERVDSTKHRKRKLNTLTKGKVYEVLEIDGFFYHIINDAGKRARYIRLRFETCIS
jgi:hypothetical protein